MHLDLKHAIEAKQQGLYKLVHLRTIQERLCYLLLYSGLYSLNHPFLLYSLLVDTFYKKMLYTMCRSRLLYVNTNGLF